MSDYEKTFDKAIDDWREPIIRDKTDVPDILWHYTDAGGLKGILDSSQLWASDVRFMNDSVEFAYGLELARNAFRKASRGKLGLDSDTERLVTALGDPGRNHFMKFFPTLVDIYVTCFCSCGDLLSQWRSYAGTDRAGGYAVGFRPPSRNYEAPESFYAWVGATLGDNQLRRVIYDEKHQVELSDKIVNKMIEIIRASPTDNNLLKAAGRFVATAILELATWCKHPSFKEEKEWRIVSRRFLNESPMLPLNVRTSDGLFIPYLKLDAHRHVGSMPNHLPIEKIRCGPSPDPERKRIGLDRLIETKSGYESVETMSSVTPARL